MCQHVPPCPTGDQSDGEATKPRARDDIVDWALLCNGVLLFDDTGELQPNGTVVAPHRPTGATGAAHMTSVTGKPDIIGPVPPASVEQRRVALTPHYPCTTAEMPLPAPVAISVGREAQHVRQVRSLAAAWLRNVCHMPESRIEQALVVISELVTNAVLHCTGQCVTYTSWAPKPGLVRVEIDDGTAGERPKPQRAAPLAESGRGLFLTDAFVADLGGEWGYCKDGTTAWCHIPVHEGSARGAVRE